MDIQNLVIELIAKVGDLDVSEIENDSLLVDDLSLDSLMFLDFVTQIEAKANSIISPKEMTQIKTVQDVIDLVIKNKE